MANHSVNPLSFVSELNDSSPRFNQPNKIKVHLKPHQLTILYKALKLENTNEQSYRKSN